MTKMKTHKASRKRFKVTASGKLKRSQAGKKHLNSPKTRQTQTAAARRRGRTGGWRENTWPISSVRCLSRSACGVKLLLNCK